MATFTGKAATANTFVGTALADVFRFASADLDFRDTVTGGGGIDLLQLTSAGKLANTALANVTGVERIALAAGGNGIVLGDGNLVGVAGGKLLITGGDGADAINAAALTGTNRIEVTAGGGLDVLRGGAGADVFRFTAAALAGDTVAGGLGSDLLVLTTAGVLAAGALAKVSGVETIKLAAGGNGITLGSANFAGVAGGTIIIQGSAGNDTVAQSAPEVANRIDVTAGAGLDSLTGAAGADTFRFAAADLAGDTIRGGGGLDTLVLSSSGALAAGALAKLSQVETILLAAGGNGITLLDANLGGVSGGRIAVRAGAAGNDTIDASALTGTRSVDITAGAGADVLRGGAGNDIFRFKAADLAGDTVLGGKGADTLMLTTAGTLAASALAQMSGVETITFAAGGNAITLLNGNYAGASYATINDAKIVVIGSDGADTVDARKLDGTQGTNGIDVTAGGGLDRLLGGASRDVFRFTASGLAGDTVTGGNAVTSIDTLIITTAGVLAANALANVTGVETIRLAAGGNSIVLKTSNLAVQGASTGSITVIGGAGNDVVDGSAVTGVNSPILITAGGGTDTLKGGEGGDTFSFAAANLSAADTVIGGAGLDSLILTTAGQLAAAALGGVSAVEEIRLANGTNALTLRDVNFAGVTTASVPTITVKGGSGNDTVNASALTGVNAIDVTAGAGTDVLRGGAGADVFRFAGTDLAGDTIAGGMGYDKLVLASAGILGSLAQMSGVDEITLAAGGNGLSLTDANFAGLAGANLSVLGGDGNDTINAAGLTGNNAIAVMAGGGNDTFTGGAGDDVFRFLPQNLTAADTITGGEGYDTLAFDRPLILADGTMAIDALAQMTGIDRILLAKTGSGLTLTNANYAVPVIGDVPGSDRIDIYGTSGASVVDAADLTGTHAIYFYDGSGTDAVFGGDGDDVVRYQIPTAAKAGDTFDGGAGTDTIFFEKSMAFLGDTITNVEKLIYSNTTNADVAVTISDVNAARIGEIGSDVFDGKSAVFTVQLAAETTTDLSNVTLVKADAGDAIKVVATSGSTTVTLSSSIASFTGSAGVDVVRFAADQTYAGGAVIAGGSGYDQVTLTTAGALAADALANMTGIDRINLAAGGNAITLTDANFAVAVSDPSGSIVVGGSAGSSSIDASSLTSANSFYFLDGGGVDTLTGGEGSDRLVLLAGNVFVDGDTFDGGGGLIDVIFVDRSMDFLGSTITNVEELFNVGSDSISVTISGENAAGLRLFGAIGINNVTDILTVQLSSGSTTDLSQLALYNADAGDAIKVASGGDGTTVTLSDQIANFGGSSGNDTVLLAAGGHYRGGAVILGGAGNDRIAFDPASTARIEGGADVDTLLVSGAVVVTLANTITAQTDGLSTVRSFENVDASASSAAVMLSGRNDFASVLIGGSAGDTINAGTAGAIITGGLGADTLTGGAGDDRFLVRADEATGDTIDGGTGDDGIEVRATANLTGAAISGIGTLYLAAADTAGNFINADLTATVTGSQAAALNGIFGNGYFTGSPLTDSMETLVVNMLSDSNYLDLSSLGFAYFGGRDHVEINGTTFAESITGSSKNDVIRGGGEADTLRGGGGDDLIFFEIGSLQTLDGGSDTDTLNMTYRGNPGNWFDSVVAVTINLGAGTYSQTGIRFGGAPDTIGGTAANFENADFGAAVFDTTLIGTNGDNTLIGGSGTDTLTGGLGADTLTGGGGADSFVWNNKLEGGDTIIGFEFEGVDKLVFNAAAFAVDGAFDTRLVDDGTGSFGYFDGADLVWSFKFLNGASEVLSSINSIDANIKNSFFYVNYGMDSHVKLYYIDANGAGPTQATFIADLGTSFFPIISEFAFV